MLIRGRAPGRTVDALLTSSIIAIAIGFPVWTLAFQPELARGLSLDTALGAFTLPVLDMSNPGITKLAQTLPLGVPVEIQA